MQVIQKNLSDTKVQLKLAADAEQLAAAKEEALQTLAQSMRLPGFRPGKAPLNLVEKNADQRALQTEFLDRAFARMYGAALDEHKLHAVAQPQIKLSKFVPFSTLEFEVEVEVIGEIKLADYKKMNIARPAAKVTAKDVDEVLANVRSRDAEKHDVDRAAKLGDQVWIDFKGVDAKTNEPIPNADGTNYPLALGSNSFIPGFEAELVGLKTNDEKTFAITFPKDYAAKALQGKKANFTVTVNKVQEVSEPKLDDAFAAKVGPFKTLEELKADIKKQLQAEKEYELERAYADEVLTKVTEASTVALPEVLINEQIERLLLEQRQNAMYRGQTWEEFLKAAGKDEESYRASLKPEAELRVKAGVILAEVAEKEKVSVTPEELDIRMQMLREEYKDAQMQAELQKPEARREIASRMMSEKTMAKLTGYTSAAVSTSAKAKTK